MNLVKKHFNELTALELYKIYKARVDVFVVEQECVYHEVDEYDKDSIHMWFEDEGEIVAYLRVLPENTTFEEPSIGRVLVLRRRQGLATKLLTEAIKVVREEYNKNKITIEAQCYARSLYEKLGFVQVSEEFLEDGIPHIKMQYVME